MVGKQRAVYPRPRLGAGDMSVTVDLPHLEEPKGSAHRADLEASLAIERTLWRREWIEAVLTTLATFWSVT
jgi:hypothetical protein